MKNSATYATDEKYDGIMLCSATVRRIIRRESGVTYAECELTARGYGGFVIRAFADDEIMINPGMRVTVEAPNEENGNGN
jgi:hypothetical protein